MEAAPVAPLCDNRLAQNTSKVWLECGRKPLDARLRRLCCRHDTPRAGYVGSRAGLEPRPTWRCL